MSEERFFGYTNSGGIIIAEREKAVIDSLLFPKYAGGINQLIRCVEGGIGEMNEKRLYLYAIRMGSNSVLRRLGFVLESAGLKKGILSKLSCRVGKGFQLLDPSLKKRNNYNTKWRLAINNDISG